MNKNQESLEQTVKYTPIKRVLIMAAYLLIMGCQDLPKPPLKPYKHPPSTTTKAVDKIRLDALERWKQRYDQYGAAVGENQEDIEKRIQDLNRLRNKYKH